MHATRSIRRGLEVLGLAPENPGLASAAAQVYAGERTVARENLLLGQLHVPVGKPGEQLNVVLDVDNDVAVTAYVQAKASGRTGEVRDWAVRRRALRARFSSSQPGHRHQLATAEWARWPMQVKLPNTGYLSLEERQLKQMADRVQGLLPWAAGQGRAAADGAWTGPSAPSAPSAPAAQPDAAAELQRHIEMVRQTAVELLGAADLAADWLSAVGRHPPADQVLQRLQELQAAVEQVLAQSLGARLAQQVRI